VTLLVGILLALVLLIIAGLHALWGLRIWWPATDERALALLSAGFAGRVKMPPPLACFAVAGALTGAASLTLSIIGILPFGTLLVPRILLGLAALVFLARGMAAYTAPWARLTPSQPFRSLDRRVYGPLCLAIGLGLLLLATD